MLANRRVLIVEDEALIAMELADIVASAGAEVIGPVRTNRDAIGLLARAKPDLAILDLNLADGDATTVYDALVAGDVPILVCTAGILPLRMRHARPGLPVHRKPIEAKRLVATLASLSERIPA